DPRFYPLNDVEADIASTPVITDNAYYFGDKNGTFYGLARSGKKEDSWKVKLDGVPLGASVLTAPTNDGRTMLYSCSTKVFVYAFDINRIDRLNRDLAAKRDKYAKPEINTSIKPDWIYRTEPPKGDNLSFYPIRTPLVADG